MYIEKFKYLGTYLFYYILFSLRTLIESKISVYLLLSIHDQSFMSLFG